MLDHLRQVIGLRGYGQRDPLNEYKSEAFTLFEALIAHLREAVTAQLMRVEIVPPPSSRSSCRRWKRTHARSGHRRGRDGVACARHDGGRRRAAPCRADRDPNDPASWGKVGRNEACPCGSGKKFKHCHGKFG